MLWGAKWRRRGTEARHSAVHPAKCRSNVVFLYLTLVSFRYAPEIGDFVYITDNAYTQSQIRDMEIKIMGVLKFDLGRPLPLHFLRRNSKAGQVKLSI